MLIRHLHLSRTLICSLLILFTVVVALGDAMDADDPITMLHSANQTSREKALGTIAAEHHAMIAKLIEIVDEPRRDENDDWTDTHSTRNLAIALVGGFRAPAAVSSLGPHLDPPPGWEQPFNFEMFHLCPAARALISIGAPSIDLMMEILATTADPDEMRANQARLVVYYVEGETEGQRLMAEAVEEEEDPQRKKALQSNSEAFVEFIKDKK